MNYMALCNHITKCNVFTVLLTPWQATHNDCLITFTNNTHSEQSWSTVHGNKYTSFRCRRINFGTHITCTCHGEVNILARQVLHMCVSVRIRFLE